MITIGYNASRLGKIRKARTRAKRHPIFDRKHAHGWATAGRGRGTTGRRVNTPPKPKKQTS